MGERHFSLAPDVQADRYGFKELKAFLLGLDGFLASLVNDSSELAWAYNSDSNDDFSTIPDSAQSRLRGMARDIYENYIAFKPGGQIATLYRALDHDNLSDGVLSRIEEHGLLGEQMHFKLAVIEATEAELDSISELKMPIKNRIRRWMERLIDAVDVVLDSLVGALDVTEKATGSAVMEFKKALRVLCL